MTSTRAAALENIEDDLVALRNLAIDVDEYADDHAIAGGALTFLLEMLAVKTEALLVDLGEAFALAKNPSDLLDSGRKAR